MGIARNSASLVAPELAKAAATAAAGGNPLAGILASSVVQAIIQVQQDQNRQLEQITGQIKLLREDTQKLLEGSYKTGLEYLAQAAQPYRSVEDKRVSVEKAEAKFMDALGYPLGKFSTASIEYQLGNCWVLLGNNNDARHYYQRAYYSATAHWADQVVNYFANELINPFTNRYDVEETDPYRLYNSVILALRLYAVGGRTFKSWYTNPFEEIVFSLRSFLYDLTDALKQLRDQAPALNLELDKSSDSALFFERFDRVREFLLAGDREFREEALLVVCTGNDHRKEKRYDPEIPLVKLLTESGSGWLNFEVAKVAPDPELKQNFLEMEELLLRWSFGFPRHFRSSIQEAIQEAKLRHEKEKKHPWWRLW